MDILRRFNAFKRMKKEERSFRQREERGFHQVIQKNQRNHLFNLTTCPCLICHGEVMMSAMCYFPCRHSACKQCTVEIIKKSDIFQLGKCPFCLDWGLSPNTCTQHVDLSAALSVAAAAPRPDSPAHAPSSPEYAPSSPAYSPSSPAHNPPYHYSSTTQ